MPITEGNGPWIRPAFLTSSRIRQVSTPCINYLALLLFRDLRYNQLVIQTICKRLHLWVDAKVLPAGQSETCKVPLLCFLFLRLRTLDSILHESLQFRECLLNFWHRTRAIYQFTLSWKILAGTCQFRHQEREMEYSLVDMIQSTTGGKPFFPCPKAFQAHNAPWK